MLFTFILGAPSLVNVFHTFSVSVGGYDGAVLIIHGDSGPPPLEVVSGTAFTYMPPLQVITHPFPLTHTSGLLA